ELVVRRVPHLLEGEAPGGDDVDRAVAATGGEDGGRPRHRTTPLPDRQQRADESPDHRVAERVGLDVGADDTVVLPQPRQPQQAPYGRRARTATAEGREVV